MFSNPWVHIRNFKVYFQRGFKSTDVLFQMPENPIRISSLLDQAFDSAKMRRCPLDTIWLNEKALSFPLTFIEKLEHSAFQNGHNLTILFLLQKVFLTKKLHESNQKNIWLRKIL